MAEEALKAVKDLPAAHLQLFLVALARGDVARAAPHLEAFAGKLQDLPLEKVLAGRLRLAEKKPAEAGHSSPVSVFLNSSRSSFCRVLSLVGVSTST